MAPEYGDRIAVVPGTPLSLTAQEAAVTAAHPGTIDKYIAPRDACSPVLFRVQGAAMIALDPLFRRGPARPSRSGHMEGLGD